MAAAATIRMTTRAVRGNASLVWGIQPVAAAGVAVGVTTAVGVGVVWLTQAEQAARRCSESAAPSPSCSGHHRWWPRSRFAGRRPQRWSHG